MSGNNKINIIAGWCVFGLSFIIYFLTVSHTVNFWDSGELIACSSSLQIGHPTGAPVYMLLGRLFSMLAINPENVSFTVNLLSVLSASFAVFFLYHTIQKLTLRIFNTKFQDLDKTRLIISLGAAIIGALSFAFSITFWSSAVQAGLNSLSLFFIAVSLWIMLKFTEAEGTYMKNKWIILCSLILGLAVGVDLHIIFIIPVLVFIFYFDKYKFKYGSFIKALFISLLLLLFVWLCIFYIPVVASKFELLFVNNFRFGYNSGLYCFAVLFIGLLVLGIYISGIKNKRLLNIFITCFAVFITGYSTYSVIIIRSAANPPIDQNNPETIFNFVSYIEQDQYGNYPLWYGQQYNSSLEKNKPYVEGDPVYDTVKSKYSVVAHKPKANYKKTDKRLLPRMWSNQPEHIAAYQEWTGYKTDKIPPFSVNMDFMFKYQFSHMYIRYFMWNFTGKQNDIQSHGGPVNGNWISGINFIDNIRLGNVKDLPPALSENKARNPYYFLPFILGILGIILQFRKDRKYLFIIGILFLLTGICIAFYLNFHPYQARERDYLFMGSYYAFSIWIGLGVVWIYEKMKKYTGNRYLAPGILILCFLAVPGQFLAKNYKDNNYRKNDFTRSFAYNVLNSCEENAILFTWGDNETFPLWYLQEVENIRTDVRIINLSFLNTDWYIEQITRKQKNSEGILLNIDKSKYISGQRELLLVKETSSAFAEDIYIENIREINEDYTYVFNSFIEILLKNGFDKSHPEEFNNFRNFYSRIQPSRANPSFKDFSAIISDLSQEEYRKEFEISEEQAEEIIGNFYKFLAKQQRYPIPLNPVLNFVFAEDKETKIETRLYDYPVDYFPAKNLMMRINQTQIKDKFNLTPGQKENIVSRMEWSLDRESITKGELIVLEIILANMWERPVYFSSTMNSRYYLGLENYLYLEGFVYRLIPIESEISSNDPVKVNNPVMYENITNKFDWGKLSSGNIYLDENSRIILTNIMNHYSRLASSLYYEGKLQESENILDICVELISDKVLKYDFYTVGIVRGYYRISKHSKAGKIAKIIASNSLEELEYYSKFPPRQQKALEIYKQKSLKSIDELFNMANYYMDKDFISEITEVYEQALKLYNYRNI